MSNTNENGYVSGALLSNDLIREMRKHVEYEKFIARMLVDDETTRKFKENTEEHQDSIHRFLYNNEFVNNHTAEINDPNVELTNTIKSDEETNG